MTLFSCAVSRRFTFPIVLAIAMLVPSLLAIADDVPSEMLAGDLKNPESVAVGADGRIYVSVIGEFDKDADGAIVVVENGKSKVFAKGLDDPKGLVAVGKDLFVADKHRVLKIDSKGKATVFAAADAFPVKPMFLNDLAADGEGNLYVSDTGDLKGSGGAVFSITPKGEVKLLVDSQKWPAIKGPNGLLWDGPDHLIMADMVSGELQRINLRDGSIVRFCTGFIGVDGLARDEGGKLYLTEWTTNRVFVLPRESRSPTALAGDTQGGADICFAADGRLLVPQMLAGKLAALSVADSPAVALDETPLPLRSEPAFPNLQLNRAVLLTHAGDGSNRVFVITQLGQIFVFPNDQDVSDPEVFLDIQDRVIYKDNENEQGLLGLAFHPRFKENGQFFVYYTTKEEPNTNVISRFQVNKDDPNRADADSEEELLRIPQPFWNHDGGTLAFGPDGYLYIGLGDGGKANDPYGNGQNLKTLLGSILRIDVDHKDSEKNYAIPKDNPFLDYPEARPEIWAYGVRNIWRLAFDRETGHLWAADVGQDLWEELNLITRGGNYGWNLREGMHPFGIGGVQQPREDLTDPIFEYHHDLGRSITGGYVYRGKRLPQLAGAYLYADYITGKTFALRYDEEKKQLLSNRHIPGNIFPVMSFGEDEQGEVYFMTTAGQFFRFTADEASRSESR